MYKLIRNISMLVAATLLVTSCSTMNKNECLTADWKTIGFSDGAKGQPASRITRHHSACAEHGVTPNLSAYNKGRSQGLVQYCTPSNGYINGLSGRKYNGICSSHNEKAYVEALEFGLVVNKEENTLTQMKRAYADEENRIYSLERGLKRAENRIVKGKLTELQRYKLIQKTKKMAEELGAAKNNLGPLSDDINQQALRVTDLKSQSKY